MNYMHRRSNPAALRFAERRRREDDAPRLQAEVPDLVSLRIEFDEQSGVAGAHSKHTRRVLVDRAPALFIVPCGDPRCAEGEHDFTPSMMQALRAHEISFQGSDECPGSVGQTPCPRVLRFDAVAEYRP